MSMVGWSAFKICFCALYFLFLSLQNATSQNSPTCNGLDQLINNTNTSLTLCNRDQNCTMLMCNTVMENNHIRSSKLILLPCTEPPSVKLVVNGGENSDDVISNQTLNRSQSVNLLTVNSGSFLIEVGIMVTLNQSIPCQLGIETAFEQTLVQLGVSSLMILNGYTIIPLDTSSCPTLSHCSSTTFSTAIISNTTPSNVDETTVSTFSTAIISNTTPSNVNETTVSTFTSSDGSLGVNSSLKNTILSLITYSMAAIFSHNHSI